MALYVGCMVEGLAQIHVFLQVIRFSPVSYHSTNN